MVMINTMHDNIALWPNASEDPKTIEYWLGGIYSDELVVAIVNSRAFLRLNDISFLGALDYTHEGGDKLKKQHRNRAEHSLHVAALASYVSDLRSYPADLRRHLIVAALLHDIGHAPLSHSAEPYIKKKIGYGHHEAGEQIIRGKTPLGSELHKILRQNLDVDLILRLIDATAHPEDGGDLFSSPLNIDTIDGIVRSHSYITGFRSTQSRLSIAKAAFFDKTNHHLSVLDSFWGMKDRVYSSLINNEFGVISDKSSELFFYDNGGLEEDDIYSSERSWQQRHKALFKSFERLMKERAKPSWIGDCDVIFTDRKYYLDQDKTDHGRFVCAKEKRSLRVNLFGRGVSNCKQVAFGKF